VLSGLKWDMLLEVFNSLKNYRLLSGTRNLLMWDASNVQILRWDEVMGNTVRITHFVNFLPSARIILPL